MPSDRLIDISRLLGRTARGQLPTGVDRVCLAHVERWGDRAQAIVQKGGWRRLLAPKESRQLFDLLLAPPPDFSRRQNLVIARACLPPWPAQDAGGRPGLYLGHSGIEAPGFAGWLAQTRQKPVFFVHDLIPLTHPEYCRAGEGPAHAARLEVMLRSGAGIVVNSAATLDALAGFAAAAGLALPPAAIAPLAPASLPAGDPSPPLAAPYFVMLGTIEPRKNHLLLLKVWRELAEQLGPAAPHLVVIGRRGWECENVVDMLERCEAIRPLVHEIAGCPDHELARYLRHARALLFPSFAEGYGMPLVEALQAGAPVIASELPVFREIAGAVPDYLNPLDGPGWRRLITDYAGGAAPARAAQLERLARFGVPGWEQHFSRVEDLLGALA